MDQSSASINIAFIYCDCDSYHDTPSTGLGLSGMPDYITKCLTNAELFNEPLCKQRFSSSRCTNRSLTKMLQAHNEGLFTVRSEVRLAIVVHIIGEIPILHKPLVDSER